MANYESLVGVDASKKLLELLFVEKISNKVYLWSQNSQKRNNELDDFFRVMQIDALDSLDIFSEMVI